MLSRFVVCSLWPQYLMWASINIVLMWFTQAYWRMVPRRHCCCTCCCCHVPAARRSQHFVVARGHNIWENFCSQMSALFIVAFGHSPQFNVTGEGIVLIQADLSTNDAASQQLLLLLLLQLLHPLSPTQTGSHRQCITDDCSCDLNLYYPWA